MREEERGAQMRQRDKDSLFLLRTPGHMRSQHRGGGIAVAKVTYYELFHAALLQTLNPTTESVLTL